MSSQTGDCQNVRLSEQTYADRGWKGIGIGSEQGMLPGNQTVSFILEARLG
jgi:hypothetical protein